jgi:hypothetical protein
MPHTAVFGRIGAMYLSAALNAVLIILAGLIFYGIAHL